MAILTEMRDPRVKLVTVTKVEVAPDMKSAKVHISVMGDETAQRLTINTLQSAAGFLQHKIAEEIDMRYTPRLQFEMDQGVKNSLEIARILSEVLPKPQAAAPTTDSVDPDATDYEFDDEQQASPQDSTETGA